MAPAAMTAIRPRDAEASAARRRWIANDPFRVTPEDLRQLRGLVRKLFETPRQPGGDAGDRHGKRLELDLMRPQSAPTARSNTFRGYLAALAEALDRWFNEDEPVAPIHAERIQLFLRRCNQPRWERAFLAVICYHFSTRSGDYDGLTRRAAELHAYPVPRTPARSPAARRAPQRQAPARVAR